MGDVIVDYLKYARPPSDALHLLMTSRAPSHPIVRASTLSAIVSRYQHRAHIKLPLYGSHCYRHGFASRALREGYSLKLIADCLGHRWLQNTQIYAKVDTLSLSTVTLELPGGAR